MFEKNKYEDEVPGVMDTQPQRGPEVYTIPSQLVVGEFAVLCGRDGSEIMFEVVQVSASKVRIRRYNLCLKKTTEEVRFLADMGLIPYVRVDGTVYWNATNYVRSFDEELQMFSDGIDKIKVGKGK